MNKFKVGDVVNYHSLRYGEITSSNHVIESIELMPNNFGCNVARITGKRGCVDIKHLSNKDVPMPVNYKNYINADSGLSFAEWVGIKK